MKIERLLITGIRFGLAILLPGLLAGCTDEKITDDPEREMMSEIHFQTTALTRAEGTSNLESGAKVRIYPYQRKKGVVAPIIADGKEYTVSSTDLTPSGVDATAMILPAGTFGFYAVSTNSASEEVPTFATTASDGYPTNNSSNSTTALQNGIDYLHATAEQKIQFGTVTQEIPLKFSHKGTQVQLEIQFSASACAASAEAAANFSEAQVWVQQSDPANAYMYLSNGQIRFGNNTGSTPLDCLSNGALDETQMAQMTVEKLDDYTAGSSIPATQVATYNMLPLQAASNQTMWIKVVILNLIVGNTNATTHTYTGKLDASAGWNAGESNRYTLILTGSEIRFSGVTVENWATGTTGIVGDVTDLK